MSRMFSFGQGFNQNIDSWDTSNVTDMSGMFSYASRFNQDLDNWDVSSVTNMSGMFNNIQRFNGNISSWDVSNVTNMKSMFNGCYDFNQDISNWNTSNVTTMEAMFASARAFNQNINSWDVSSVTTFYRFLQAAENFNNGDAAGVSSNTLNWDVSNANNLGSMFSYTEFNQNISGWCVPSISTEPSGFSSNSPLTNENKPVWGTCNSQATLTLSSSDSDNNITSGVVTVTATFSENMAASPLISIAGLVTNTAMIQGASAAVWTYFWPIPSSVTTGTYAVTVAATDTNSKPYGGNERLDLSIAPTFYLDANGVTIKCPTASNGDTGVINGKTYTAVNEATLRSKINNGDADLDCVCTSLMMDMNNLFQNVSSNQDISSWDTANVTNMRGMFKGANVSSALNYWDTANVTSMYEMFGGNANFNQDISDWDTSSVTIMTYMFSGASSFNQNINGWDTSSVTDMSHMFGTATSFNQNINGWNTTNVANMEYMFHGASVFDQAIGGWDTSSITTMKGMFKDATTLINLLLIGTPANVTEMTFMFQNASSFNQNINSWNVSNVTNMGYMFYGATAFNQPLNGWDTSSLDIAITCSNWHQALINPLIIGIYPRQLIWNICLLTPRHLTKIFLSWCVTNINAPPIGFADNSGIQPNNYPQWGGCDTSPPTIISVKGNPVSGVYTDNDASPTNSDVVLLEILFSENVNVDTSSGTPTLELETGDNDRDAVYVAGSGNSTLSFAYTVQDEDLAGALDYKTVNSLNLNGGTITDNVETLSGNFPL